MKLVTLVGGTNDGQQVRVYSFQPSVYRMKRISVEEHAALAIDERMSWKPPEEVYEKNKDGDFVYSHTVHYKPEDFVATCSPGAILTLG